MPTITGVTLSACTTSTPGVCNATGPEIADTVGGNAIPNLYDFESPPGSGFVNSGNTSTSVALNVSLPTFAGISQVEDLIFQPTGTLNLASGSWYEANIFFDGNTTTPGISLYATAPGVCSGGACSQPNGGTGYSLTGALVPGAGSFELLSGGSTYIFAMGAPVSGSRGTNGNGPAGRDLVGMFNNTPDQANDYSFSLQVINITSPVPEPETWALLVAGVGLTVPLGMRRRRSMPLPKTVD